MNKFTGKGLPKDGDILTLNIPLTKAVEKYKKDGVDREFTFYAKAGSKFGGVPIGDGSLMIKYTIYPAKSVQTPDTVFSIG